MPVAPYSKTAGFGPGFLSAIPVTGWNAAVPIDPNTPITFALIESVSLDFSFKLKELYSQSVYPIAGGASTGKVTGKAKISSFSPSIMNSLFFGASSAGSGVTVVQYAPNTIPSSTPWQITPASPAATVDLGVFYSTVGTGVLQKQFAKVASGPTAGQYSFSAGVYTFATADANTAILISYGGTAAGSSSFNMGNQLSGMAPQFQLNFSGVYGGNVYLFNFPNCSSEKLMLTTKVNDWVGVEFDFEVFTGADPGSLGTVYMVS
jgi:hypothetical protein